MTTIALASQAQAKNRLEYFDDTLKLCRTGHDDVSHTRITTLAVILLGYFPLIISDSISCPLYNLNTLWNTVMILHSYVEQVMTMCRVQEWKLPLSHFLSDFPLMVSDAISCPLHNLKTVWNIIMILHSIVEQAMTICRLQK